MYPLTKGSLATLVVSTTLLFAATVAHAADEPRARTDALLGAFMRVKPLPDDGSVLSDGDKASNRKVFEELDTYFDYDTFTKACLGANASKFSAEQRSRFDSVFKELIRRIAYPDSGTFLKKSKTKLNPAKIEGKKATVLLNVEVPAEDLEMETLFHWQNSGGWRVVDVSFDGASLVKDYQNQFGRIITKDGVDGLLNKLDKRLKKALEESVL